MSNLRSGYCHCGHSQRHHVDGHGLCLVKSCRLCLIYRARGVSRLTTGGQLVDDPRGAYCECGSNLMAGEECPCETAWPPAGREFHWATTAAVAELVPGTTLASQMVRNVWEVHCSYCGLRRRFNDACWQDAETLAAGHRGWLVAS